MIYVDTSALLPALVAAHPQHEPLRDWLDRTLGRTDVGTSFHTVAELTAVLSGIFRVPLPDVKRQLEWMRTAFVLVPLVESDYLQAPDRLHAAGLSGGSVYDALHVACAARLGATRLAHVDKRSFPRLLPASRRIELP